MDEARLQPGARWRYVSANGAPTKDYVVEWCEDREMKGRLCALRNVETGGLAQVSAGWLERPKLIGHWDFVALAPMEQHAA